MSVVTGLVVPFLVLAASVLLALAVLVLAALRYALVHPLIGSRPSHPGGKPGAVPDAATQDDRDPRALASTLERHIVAIASRPHNIDHYPALEAAAQYIEATLSAAGLTPVPQRYQVDGYDVRNIEVVITPPDAGPDTPTFVLGAHYDSADDSPGAHDNGTGVAAALELARRLGRVPPQSIRLRVVFWVNEEQPYGKSPDMGSWRHAQRLKASGEPVIGALALETLGYFSRRTGSQQFPFPFGLIYPRIGDFVAFVGLPGSRALTHRLTRSFRRHCDVPSIGGVAPGFIPGVDLSDHWAYHQFGFPALMVTDTAPFRNPYYHQTDDLPATVDYATLQRITLGLERAIRDIAP